MKLSNPDDYNDDDDVGFYSGCASRIMNKMSAKSLAEKMKEFASDDDDTDDQVYVSSSTAKLAEAPCTLLDDSILSQTDSALDSRLLNASLVRSPTPPPSPPKNEVTGKQRSYRTKKKRDLENAVKVLDADLQYAQSQLNWSNNSIVGEDVCVIDDVEDDTTTVRILVHGQIERFQLRPDDPMSLLISQIAQQNDRDGDNIMLVLNDRSLKLSDTPASLNLSVADIITCHILEQSHTHKTVVIDADMIEVVVQTSTLKHKETIRVGSNASVGTIIEEYSKRTGKNVVKVRFDGDTVNLKDTVQSLGLEDGDILDVLVT
ncbi:NFATC2-interacting protein-like isoform X2 [Dreissena polymorpha]|nr:NFATC2-interacting protein-like isoform X2 [Dreissena polymorpha]